MNSTEWNQRFIQDLKEHLPQLTLKELDTLVDEVVNVLISPKKLHEEEDGKFLDQYYVKYATTALKATLKISRIYLDRVEAEGTDEREAMDEEIENLFIALLNLFKYEDPWYPDIRKDHLVAGFDIRVDDRYCLYGQTRFSNEELPEDIRRLPQSIDRDKDFYSQGDAHIKLSFSEADTVFACLPPSQRNLYLWKLEEAREAYRKSKSD